jgi:hypothetical protein
MPSARRQKKTARPNRKAKAPVRRPAARPPPRPTTKKPVAKPTRPAGTKSASRAPPAPPAPALEVPLPGGRRHVLSLSFVRDGDEFLARLETDSGHITELKNRSLDQLLTLVAGELEDLLE